MGWRARSQTGNESRARPDRIAGGVGQRATAEKSNEKTAIPELLAPLAQEGCIVTVDAMHAAEHCTSHSQPGGGLYILAAESNQPKLAESKCVAATSSISLTVCTPLSVGPICSRLP